MIARERDLILWDGECGFCRRSAVWVTQRDEGADFEAMPYQAVAEPWMTPALADACGRSVHLVLRDGSMLTGGRAILYILGELGWRRSARLLSRPPMIWAVELGYRMVASNRALLSRFLFRHD